MKSIPQRTARQHTARAAQSFVVQQAVSDATHELAIARAYWRKYRQLVEAPEWPLPYPEVEPELNDQALSDEFPDWIRAEVHLILQAQKCVA